MHSATPHNSARLPLKLEFSIDWLAFTCHRLNTTGWRNIAIHYPDEIWASTTPKHGYTLAAVNQAGCRIMENLDRPDMGQNVRYSGHTLNKYIDAGISPHDILVHHNVYADRCNRIDLAIDVYNGKLDPADYYDVYSAGTATTRCRDVNLLISQSGKTLYIGSRESEVMMRIYDKAKQLGMEGDWKRVELEIKGSRARRLAPMIMTGSPDEQIATGRGMMRKLINFNIPAWDKVTGSETVTIAKGKDTLPDTEKWLMGQVATAMARVIHETANSQLMNQFIHRVNDILSDYDD